MGSPLKSLLITLPSLFISHHLFPLLFLKISTYITYFFNTLIFQGYSLILVLFFCEGLLILTYCTKYSNQMYRILDKLLFYKYGFRFNQNMVFVSITLVNYELFSQAQKLLLIKIHILVHLSLYSYSQCYQNRTVSVDD